MALSLTGFFLMLLTYSGQSSAGGRPANCTLIVKSEIIFNGTCDFYPVSNDGSFQIARGNVFADVSMDEPGVALGSWTGRNGGSHAHDPLGTLIRDFRDPACWANDNARVCAR